MTKCQKTRHFQQVSVKAVLFSLWEKTFSRSMYSWAGAAGNLKQVAQWVTIAHLEASIMFGDTIIDDAQRQVSLNLKQ